MQSEAYDLLVLGQLTYITASHANLANRLKIHNFKKNQQCCYRPRWVAVSLSDSVELREGNFLESILWNLRIKKTRKQTQWAKTRGAHSGEKLTCFGVGNGHLGQVTVVVPLHFQVKHLRLGIARLCNQEFV